jgi:hypothetical protein
MCRKFQSVLCRFLVFPWPSLTHKTHITTCRNTQDNLEGTRMLDDTCGEESDPSSGMLFVTLRKVTSQWTSSIILQLY